MTETKKSGQPKIDAGNTAATTIHTDDDATNTETLSDIEKKEVVAPSDSSSAQDEDKRSTTKATPDGEFDSASGEGTRGKDDAGPM